MKNFIILLVAGFCFASCDSISGNGNVRQENRNIPQVKSVKTSGSIDIEIKNGDNYAVIVENDENLLPYIITNVNNGVLNVSYKDGYNISNDHAKVYVTAPSFEKIATFGSGDINTNGIIKSDGRLDFNLSGSGDIEAGVDAPSVTVTGSGSGDIKLSGRTKDFDCKASGSGDVNCGNLQSENTKITISGSGDAHVFASVHLVARTSGSGDIFYLGNATSPEIHTSGSGTVQAQK